MNQPRMITHDPINSVRLCGKGGFLMSNDAALLLLTLAGVPRSHSFT